MSCFKILLAELASIFPTIPIRKFRLVDVAEEQQIACQGLHHVSVPVKYGPRRSVLCRNSASRPANKSQTGFAGAISVHLMPSPRRTSQPGGRRPWRSPGSKRSPAASDTFRPYQLTVDQARRRDITSADEPRFRNWHHFRRDPDGNTANSSSAIAGSRQNPRIGNVAEAEKIRRRERSRLRQRDVKPE